MARPRRRARRPRHDGGFRSTVGVLVDPLHDEFGWSTASISVPAALNLMVYGAGGPFASGVAAAGLLVTIGVFDLVGTLASGWRTDRYEPRVLLAWCYGLRGLSLLAVPVVIESRGLGLVAFVMFYGLDCAPAFVAAAVLGLAASALSLRIERPGATPVPAPA